LCESVAVIQECYLLGVDVCSWQDVKNSWWIGSYILSLSLLYGEIIDMFSHGNKGNIIVPLHFPGNFRAPGLFWASLTEERALVSYKLCKTDDQLEKPDLWHKMSPEPCC